MHLGIFADGVDKELLVTGTDQTKWKEAARAARNAYEAESSLVDQTSLESVLAPPTPSERKLCLWILRPDVFGAVENWVDSGAWKRASEVAITAASWKRLRVLLVEGYKHAYLNDGERGKSIKAAASLHDRSFEARHGGKSYLCSAPGCVSKASKCCARCKKASYCSVDCQRAHWANGHRKECKKLAASS